MRAFEIQVIKAQVNADMQASPQATYCYDTDLQAGDYSPAAVREFEKGSFQGAYSSNGWRPIAYAFFDDTGEYGSRWKRVEQSAFKLGYEEVVDIYEALYGPLEDLPDDASEETKIEQRRKLVNVVRLLLGALKDDLEKETAGREEEMRGRDFEDDEDEDDSDEREMYGSDMDEDYF
ncbi:unnamed protein product [Cyclocybe aegerita]|uniref:Uncharacterized protein n=1 Tax=Cyclocybe aegerita TaxID=1973307 RepID=A0A8S0W2H5_CYCAE|nr:unnamed protein product [Cyclocybe aegerita]